MARPRKTRNHKWALPVCNWHLRAWRCDDRLCVHDPCPLSRYSVFVNIRIFRSLFAAFNSPVHNFDPADPLDPHVAFPARDDKAHRITVLHPQGFAVGLERNNHVIQGLFHWDSILWIIPCVNWTPFSCAPAHSMPVLAAHSQK